MLIYWIWLTLRKGMGDRLRLQLLQHFGTPEAIYTADPKALEQVEGMTVAARKSLLERDLAYHQGTTWVFPMGAYYLAYLKTHENAKAYVRSQLEALEPMLFEGCAGQLPEIYEGDFPTESKGCFGQAWSVSEILRVFEAIEKE